MELSTCDIATIEAVDVFSKFGTNGNAKTDLLFFPVFARSAPGLILGYRIF